MPMLTQEQVDEFLSTTVYGLLKNDKNVTPQFIARQKELLEVLKEDRHLVAIRSSKTKLCLLHAAASNNALLLGKFLVDKVNATIMNFDPHAKAAMGDDDEDESPSSKQEASSPMLSGGAAAASSGARMPPNNRTRRPQQIEKIITAADFDPDGAGFVDLMEAEDVSKMTPLMYASFEGNLHFIDLLCDNGADVLAQDELGNTALHWAVQGGEHEACANLLSWERGAQALCLSDKLGQTPNDIARIYDRKFWHIRNHQSLLEVLAKEYTRIKIPSLGFLLRTERKARFVAMNAGQYSALAMPIITREQQMLEKKKRPKPRSSFCDVGGGWMP
ncbi:unnamed protein product [Amoebophrya sp. A25]|nr:unnamed protein product [Amoebophrya sp. A25]|eukprot:GSA25T00003006001.1